MVLLDSNIIIYLRNPEWGDKIVQHLNGERLDTCNVIISEVLGFKGLQVSDSRYFEQLFATMKNYSFNDAVTKRVIEIRRAQTIQLLDAIIAATALVNDLTLWTHNTDDFDDISGLRLFDPITD